MSLAQYSSQPEHTFFTKLNEKLNVEYSVSLKFSHLLLFLISLSLSVAYGIRYRVSRTYSRLSKELDNNEEDDQSIAADMWKEFAESDSDSYTEDTPVTSHFDEFLKAIKVFGYLEHDVFTELTKSTHTLRVQKGEVIKLKDLGGFAVVISGAMKVYCRSNSQCDGEDDDGSKSIFNLPGSTEKKDMWADYDLLNEITVSAPISSLSSILSLFSETIESNSAPSEFDKVNATVLAVASEPSTIVVIPAQAFKKLTHKFPQAAANIVQVILFRWSQITVRTCQRYLNLTQEFYGTERILNMSAQQRIEGRLPRHLIDGVVRKMKKMSEESEENFFELRSYRSDFKSRDDENEELEDADIDERFGSPLLASRERSMSYGQSSSYLNLLSSAGVKNGKFKGRGINSSSNNIRDPEEFELRKAIVDTMFTTIRVDSPFAFPNEFNRTDSQNVSPFEFAGAFGVNDSELSHENVAQPPRNDSFMVRSTGKNAYPWFKEDRHDSIEEEDEEEEGEEKVNTGKQTAKHPALSYSEIVEKASEVVELYWYKKGEYISKTGDKCRGLIYVFDGLIEVGYHSSQSEKNSYQKLYDVVPGEITGFLETIASYSSFVDVIAKEDSCIAIISKGYFEKLAETYPLLYITAAKALTTSLTRPIVQLDFALEWISIKSGDRLVSQGQSANAVYFVLNGRMRVYNKKNVIGDCGQGSTIGELETMSGERYPGPVIAVRDTELSRFPKTLVECLARQHPSVTFEMSRIVMQAMKLRTSQTSGEPNVSDFKTFAILSTSPNLPVEDFALRLKHAFLNIGKDVTVLTHSIIMRQIGKYTHHKMGLLRLKACLADLEEKNDIILYVAKGDSTAQWSRTCIGQADCVLLLADGSGPSVFSDVEKMVVKSPTSSRVHLILLHNEKVVSHGSTAKWLKHRPWISAHYHVQMPFISDVHNQNLENKSRVQRKINQIKERVQDEIRGLQKQIKSDYDNVIDAPQTLQYKDDFSRLARLLAGEAVGLVLGGGGARGMSHIGVLQALEEAGVPIDIVGGTSIGSFIGGLYAKEYDIVPVMRKSKLFSVKMSSFWRLLLDLTYPMTSWTTGHAFNSAVWKCVGDSRIEDFWVRFFTNTTNLTDSKMEVHERGYAWRFIRASMSLAGLLPPLEEKGKMLLDGGYVDNLPVFEMKKMGVRHIIAVDVGAVDDTTPISYGDTLSGFGALFNKFNAFSSRPNVPNIAEIQQRLTYVSSVKALEEAKRAPGVIYMRPPIDNYATLDFSKFDEIREVGFKYGKEAIKEQVAKGALPSVRGPSRTKQGVHPVVKYRRYSF